MNTFHSESTFATVLYIAHSLSPPDELLLWINPVLFGIITLKINYGILSYTS